MFLKLTLILSLIITIIARILDTFLFRLNMLLKMILIWSLIIAIITTFFALRFSLPDLVFGYFYSLLLALALFATIVDLSLPFKHQYYTVHSSHCFKTTFHSINTRKGVIFFGSKTELDHFANKTKKFSRRQGRESEGREGWKGEIWREGWWWLDVDKTEIFSVLLT